MKVLKEDREEAGEELKQAMSEVERLRAMAEKSESTTTAAAEKLKKEVTLGKKTLQATTLRLNKTIKEKEAEIASLKEKVRK